MNLKRIAPILHKHRIDFDAVYDKMKIGPLTA